MHKNVLDWPPQSLHNIGVIRGAFASALMNLFPERRFGKKFVLSGLNPSSGKTKSRTFHLSMSDDEFAKTILCSLWSENMAVSPLHSRPYAHDLMSSVLPIRQPCIHLTRCGRDTSVRAILSPPLTWKSFWAAVASLFPERGTSVRNVILLSNHHGVVAESDPLKDTVRPDREDLDVLCDFLNSGTDQFYVRLQLVSSLVETCWISSLMPQRTS